MNYKRYKMVIEYLFWEYSARLVKEQQW